MWPKRGVWDHKKFDCKIFCTVPELSWELSCKYEIFSFNLTWVLLKNQWKWNFLSMCTVFSNLYQHRQSLEILPPESWNILSVKEIEKNGKVIGIINGRLLLPLPVRAFSWGTISFKDICGISEIKCTTHFKIDPHFIW